MKKPTSKRVRGPSAASLAELPEIALASFVPHRNPYAAKIAAEGIELIHDGPSAASLADIPEATFTERARRNPYAARLAEDLHRVRVGRGRPRAGEEVGPTPGRTIRLPAAIWSALEAEAEAHGLTVHAVLRAAVSTYLQARLDGTTARAPSRRRRR